ncbi:TetR/AcrR family transcriptional regulator [Sinomonas sp. JGH33]|uniref:TetR/AcrR family transcriptional regulator n=1 Tax=Sinomonas terricola TaxID=3110330 RepID=A0ABU5T9G5_9MICC|nr:TetR/AcrR family transcriptional regulator [Sinomonas sp. JGH33]MEA5456162.1 TetR/AcrR family transcriptional regulator [Sinomonas sp. JGH33]
MPKIVDHDQRRIELVDATWRIIAERGLDGATMRDIAAEAGFANGALKPYFPTKDRLLDFAFEHIFTQTNRRMAAATSGLGGLAALRAYCHEILPLDDERLSEARVAIAFWQKALRDPAKAAVHERSMEQWRAMLAKLIRGAGFRDSDADLESGAGLDSAVGAVMDLVLGAQITATLSPSHHSPAQLAAQLDCLLNALVKGDNA